VFAVHDPAFDPKEMAEGGKRPHIHAHAIVTMRSETGERIVTSPRLFREWRSLMAEKAREHGIDMELTDRREFASAPAYSRSQVRPVSYRGRTEHEGTSQAAHLRYRAKRSNEMNLAASERSRHYAATAAQVWTDVANEEPGTPEGKFAILQKARLERVAEIGQTDLVLEGSKQETGKNAANMIEVSQIANGEDGQMREMTRPEFEAYEKRVEAVLSSVKQTLDAAERNEFDEVAAAAREVVDIRREYLAFTEQQSDLAREDLQRGGRDDQRDDTNGRWDAAVARYGRETVETANEVLIEVEHYREGLSRIEAGELPRTHGASYQNGLAREVQRAAEMAVDGDNQYVREVAKSDQELQRAIELIELAQGQARRSAEREQRGADQASGGSDAKGPDGVPSGIVEREQTRETDRENQSAPDQNVHGVDRENSPASGQESSRDRDRRPDDASRSPTEVARADPPQQHVPRLRQLELEIEERHDRDRDDRER
jgi:soluble cytochrome b562